MKKFTLISIIALIATVGFAQKNINIHNNWGQNIKLNTAQVDSITFTDFATPGTLIIDMYNDTTMSMNSHGKVTWSATYKGNNTDIQGGFDYSEQKLYFDEANPANIYFDGKVKLSTTNTFEPGREGPGHCVFTSLGVVQTGSYNDTTYHMVGGVVIDTVVTVVWPDSGLVDSTDWAYLSAGPGDVVRYGDDYMAMADFTYKGLTTQVPVLLKYVGSTVQTATRNYHNFQAYFSFTAGNTASDPYYCGSSIKSLVRVQINVVVQEDF